MYKIRVRLIDYSFSLTVWYHGYGMFFREKKEMKHSFSFSPSCVLGQTFKGNSSVQITMYRTWSENTYNHVDILLHFIVLMTSKYKMKQCIKFSWSLQYGTGFPEHRFMYPFSSSFLLSIILWNAKNCAVFQTSPSSIE